MKFYYDEKNAAKYQLLNFPRFYWAENFIPQEISLLSQEGFADEERVMEATAQWMREMEAVLKPLGREIEKYYGQSWHEIHLFNTLMKVVDFFNEPSVFTWLEKAMKVDEYTLRLETLLIAWRSMEEGNEKDIPPDQLEKITAVAKDMGAWSGFLEETLLPKEECWRILQFLVNPLDHVKGYYDLLKKIEPLYLAQGRQINMAHQEGNKVAQGLNEDVGYLKVSYSLQSDELYREIAREGKIRIISFLLPNSVSITENPPFMAVGYQVTFIMQLLLERQKNLYRHQAETFKALGDNTRYELFVLIAQGINTTKELAQRLNISGASVTYHIQILVEMNLLHVNWRKKPLKERINKDRIIALGKELQADLEISN